MKNVLPILTCSVLMLLTLITKATASDGGNKEPPWVMDVPVSSVPALSESSARAQIVIYRLQADNNKSLAPLNVFINKNYHASLYPEHQAVGVSVCPGNISVIAELGNNISSKREFQQNYSADSVLSNLKAGETYFYQIDVNPGGRISGQWVNADLAKKVLTSVKVQSHTLSRVDEHKQCPTSSYSFNASTLFKFGQYDQAGLLPGASAEIKKVASSITGEYQSISNIVVLGHADPLGDSRKNQFISEQRAHTVMQQLIHAGLSSDLLSASGVGSDAPVVSCNQYKKRSDIIDCNQPNRRVEIEIYGVKNR